MSQIDIRKQNYFTGCNTNHGIQMEPAPPVRDGNLQQNHLRQTAGGCL
jgi:hypothetical protein